MSQVTVTTTTTTPPVTVLCSRASFRNMNYDGCNLCVPNNIRSTWCGLATQLILRGTMRGYVGCTTMPQQQQLPVPDASSDTFQPCHGSSTGECFLWELSLPLILISCVCVSYGVCFQVPIWLPFLPVGSQPWRLQHHHDPLVYSLGKHIWLLVMVCGLCWEFTKWPATPTALSRGSLMLHIQLPPNHFMNIEGYMDLWVWQRVTWSFSLPNLVGMALF